jgi:hypothetical protein
MSINADNIIGTYDIYTKQYIVTFTEKPTLVVPPADCSFSLTATEVVEIIPIPEPTDQDCSFSLAAVYSGPARTATISGLTTSNVNTNVTLTAVSNNFTGYEWAWTGGNVNGDTTEVVTATSSSAGTVNYGVTINGVYTDTHSINWTEPYSATITGPTSQTINSNITLTGEDDGFIGSTWAWTGGAAAGLTSKVITITETSSGTQTYGVTINGTYSDTHNVTWSPPAPFIQINAPTSGTVNSNITLTAEDYNFTGATWAWTGGAAQGLTSKTITITETSTGSVTYGATVNGTYTDTHTVNWSSAPTFTCSDLNFAISDGTTGATINLNSDITVDEGTVTAVTPSTYQSGSSTYYPTVTIPATYAGAGTSVTFDGTSGNPDCGDTATGTSSTPTYTCSDAGYTQADGLAGNSTSSLASFTDSNITTYTISPSTYTSGSATYTATITVPAGYTNSGQSLTLTACPATAFGESGSISPDPITSFTQSTSSSTTIQVTSNVTWSLNFPGGGGTYFSASPSGGSAGTNINVTLTYTVGDGGWDEDKTIRLASPTPNILDAVTIEYST